MKVNDVITEGMFSMGRQAAQNKWREILNQNVTDFMSKWKQLMAQLEKTPLPDNNISSEISNMAHKYNISPRVYMLLMSNEYGKNILKMKLNVSNIYYASGLGKVGTDRFANNYKQSATISEGAISNTLNNIRVAGAMIGSGLTLTKLLYNTYFGLNGEFKKINYAASKLGIQNNSTDSNDDELNKLQTNQQPQPSRNYNQPTAKAQQVRQQTNQSAPQPYVANPFGGPNYKRQNRWAYNTKR